MYVYVPTLLYCSKLSNVHGWAQKSVVSLTPNNENDTRSTFARAIFTNLKLSIVRLACCLQNHKHCSQMSTKNDTSDHLSCSRPHRKMHKATTQCCPIFCFVHHDTNKLVDSQTGTMLTKYRLVPHSLVSRQRWSDTCP